MGSTPESTHTKTKKNERPTQNPQLWWGITATNSELV